MRLLVLGGTSFVGRAFVVKALERGHDVTTLNRGKTDSDVTGVTAIRGDRERPDDLERIASESWDAVIDSTGYVPRVVASSAAALAGNARMYLFVSSTVAHRDWPGETVNEDFPIRDCPSSAGPEGGDYGTLKAGCERAVAEHFTGLEVLLRPNLVLGPYENVGTLTYWLRRIAASGQLLAPGGNPNRPIQAIDVRDLAAFGIHRLESGESGVFNPTGPRGRESYGSMLRYCQEVTGSEAEPVWAEDTFLLGKGLAPFTDLPLWIPDEDAASRSWNLDTEHSEKAGLTCRPLRETVVDTWNWMLEVGAPPRRTDVPASTLNAEREQQLLAEWHQARA